MKAWRWFAAFIVGCLVYVGMHSSNDTVRAWITRVVYSTDDLQYVRQLLEFESPEMIVTSGQPLTQFTGIKRYGAGFIIRFEEPLTLTAKGPGVIVFTGHTATMRKLISISYDNGITATFGWLDDFYHLPYSAVSAGEVIGFKDSGEIYIEVEQYGVDFTLEQTVDWLRYD